MAKLQKMHQELTETKHTPGPWKLSHSIIEAPESKKCIVSYEVPIKQQSEEGQANARLIAAAPETAEERDRLKEINKDLLEALTATVTAWKAAKAGDFAALNFMNGAESQAIAAIKKAEDR